MNIKITYNWLLDYLDTDATPYELQKYLSLAGPAIERVDKVGDDYVFDIEVTSNRVDMASVFGVAQEAQAILTQFGKRAKLKSNPLSEFTFQSLGTLKEEKRLDIQIKDKGLVSRFAAIVLSNIQIKKSPEHIAKRLVACDIKSINNVVDISNYLMLALGQPVHMFDYDQIKDGRMIVRESKKGEKIMTLDKIEVVLPGGDIVIEDGTDKLIDLCGIMGGLSSSITAKTKNVVLFVQTYDKKKIRKTSMGAGQRTVAATYFEKGLDEERVEPTLAYGVELLKQYAGATPSSKLYDIYEKKKKEAVITIDTDRVNLRIGAPIKVSAYESILTNLGFKVAKSGKSSLKVTVPTYRVDDVLVEEDIAEEIARIYGYHNLPSTLAPMTYVQRNEEVDRIFEIQSKIKHYLKALGLHETYNYSMISKELMENLGLSVEHHLKLSNTISDELTYMRTSLLPSLIKNLKENQGKDETLKFFEIAKVYYPQKGDLPKEVYKVAIATNTDFLDLKGIIFALLRELNIVAGVTVKRSEIPVFSTHIQADTVLNGTTFGTLGQLNPTYQSASGLKSPVYLASLDLLTLVQNTTIIPTYKKINPYAVVKLDLTLKIDDFAAVVKKAKDASSLLEDVELIDSYKDQKTLRFYFSSDKKNLTEKEAQAELEKIKRVTG